MATTTTSPRDMFASQLGSDGLFYLASIGVAASNTTNNLSKINAMTNGEQHPPLEVMVSCGTALDDCRGIVEANKTFSTAQDRTTLLMLVAEILIRLDNLLANTNLLLKQSQDMNYMHIRDEIRERSQEAYAVIHNLSQAKSMLGKAMKNMDVTVKKENA